MNTAYHLRRVTDGPHAGCYIVERSGDTPLRGVGSDGHRWQRQPYYGHVRKVVRGWAVSPPGGAWSSCLPRTAVPAYRTRHDAAEALLRLGRSA